MRRKRQKMDDTLLSYIWLSSAGAPVWYVRSLPGLHPTGTAVTGEEQDAGEVTEMKDRVKGGFISASVFFPLQLHFVFLYCVY